MNDECVEKLSDMGNVTSAAKLAYELGELFEAEGQSEEAIAAYQKAHDYFDAEKGSTSSAHKALERIATLQATLDPPDLTGAAELFSRLGQESISNNLLKFKAKDFFFRAFLCTLARADPVAADSDLARYKEMDYTFSGCREAKLCDDALQAFKDMNSEAFTDAVYNYDQISKLDPWKTTCVSHSRIRFLASVLFGTLICTPLLHSVSFFAFASVLQPHLLATAPASHQARCSRTTLLSPNCVMQLAAQGQECNGRWRRRRQQRRGRSGRRGSRPLRP